MIRFSSSSAHFYHLGLHLVSRARHLQEKERTSLYETFCGTKEFKMLCHSKSHVRFYCSLEEHPTHNSVLDKYQSCFQYLVTVIGATNNCWGVLYGCSFVVTRRVLLCCIIGVVSGGLVHGGVQFLDGCYYHCCCKWACQCVLSRVHKLF